MFNLWKCIGYILFIWFAGLLMAASPGSAQEVRVGAGAAPTENIFAKIKEPMEKALGLKLTLTSNGPVEAIKALDQGAVDAASGGLTFPDWMSLMEKEGYTIADKGAYKYRVIGKDIVKAIVHKDVAVKALSKDQLKGVFSGKTSNWKELGGADLPVVVVWGSKIPGTNSVFQKQILDGEEYTKSIVEVGTAADVKAKVAATPGAIGIGPVSIVDATIGAPEIPEVGRPITIITKGAPSAEVSKMLDFIAGDGQQYLSK